MELSSSSTEIKSSGEIKRFSDFYVTGVAIKEE